MSLLGKIAGAFRRTKPARQTVFLRQIPIKARYDAAQTSKDNSRYWGQTDNLSPDAANSKAVREIVRQRARYEFANNSYGAGINRTYANDVVTGKGPAPQFPFEEPEFRSFIELKYRKWAREIKLATKLRTMVRAKIRDGEAFAVLFTNLGLKSEIKLDIRLVEADRVTTPDFSYISKPNAVDGIVFDEWGNPKEYHILREHPGTDRHTYQFLAFDRVPAEFVVHLFDVDRPEQHRGITELISSLPLFAQLRQYRQAVLGAARTAANFALFMKTTLPPSGEAASVDPIATMEIEENMAAFIPEGWEPFQLKAEQPMTTVGEFSHDIITEAARPIHMPRNVALGDSSEYNYASGRMDHQTYFKAIDVERETIEDVMLDRLASAWLKEATLVFPQVSIAEEDLADMELAWMWGGQEHVDPEKEANAQETRLRNFTSTLAEESARDGVPWEARLEQRAKELAKMKELDLPVPSSRPKSTPLPQDGAAPADTEEGGGNGNGDGDGKSKDKIKRTRRQAKAESFHRGSFRRVF